MMKFRAAISRWIPGLWTVYCVSLAAAQSLPDPTRPPVRTAAEPAPALQAPTQASSTIRISIRDKTRVWFNDSTVRVGDLIDNARVVAIESQAIVVHDEHGRRRLSLSPGVTKKNIQP